MLSAVGNIEKYNSNLPKITFPAYFPEPQEGTKGSEIVCMNELWNQYALPEVRMIVILTYCLYLLMLCALLALQGLFFQFSPVPLLCSSQ